MLFSQIRKCGCDLGSTAGDENLGFPSNTLNCGPGVAQLIIRIWIALVDEEANRIRVGDALTEQLHSLSCQGEREKNEASRIATGSIETGDKSRLDWVGPVDEDDRDRCRCGLCCES